MILKGWGNITKIISIDDNVVVYDCEGERNNNSNDGYFRDTKEVIRKEFYSLPDNN